MTFKCISEYANLRLSYLSSQEAKNIFIINMSTNLIELITCPAVKQPAEATADTQAQCQPHLAIILQKNSTFREVARLVSKFQNNISLRHLINTGQ